MVSCVRFITWLVVLSWLVTSQYMLDKSIDLCGFATA